MNVREFIRQLSVLPLDAEVWITDYGNVASCLPPVIVYGHGTVEIATPSDVGDQAIGDLMSTAQMEREMLDKGEGFNESEATC